MNVNDELDSTCGVSDKEMIYRFQQGVRIENKIKKLKEFPIAGYDAVVNEDKYVLLEF